jgi:hypothetical protein
MHFERRTFDASSVKGLKAAEKYKQRLENKYDRVITTPAGFNHVRIGGSSKPSKVGRIAPSIPI